MNLQTVLDFLPERKPIPTHTILTLNSTLGFSHGSIITFHTYDQSPFARFLKWAFNINPPTNHTSMRVSRIIGKSQVELEQIDA